jgi:spore maturation protein CgeB
MTLAAQLSSRDCRAMELPPRDPLKIVIIGLAITSSWGNGHATTYRSLVRELARRGHDVVFLECDRSWYAANRDMPEPPGCRTELYQTTADLKRRFGNCVRSADLVIVGSYVADGITVAAWVTSISQGLTAFYDIDTPVTLAALEAGTCEYISPQLIPRFNMYLSFTGGPTLERLERDFGAPRAFPFYCSVDPELYFPEERETKWDLGYLGTYSPDRQATVDRLLLGPAQHRPQLKFIVAGPQYPKDIRWPKNVKRVYHLPPANHRAFYNAQRFTLNVTRADMIRAGFSPSVRLFEAAACGVPIISDPWPGLASFFEPGKEILPASTTQNILDYLLELPETQRRAIGMAARKKVLANHTAAHRARELEDYVDQIAKGTRRAPPPGARLAT